MCLEGLYMLVRSWGQTASSWQRSSVQQLMQLGILHNVLLGCTSHVCLDSYLDFECCACSVVGKSIETCAHSAIIVVQADPGSQAGPSWGVLQGSCRLKGLAPTIMFVVPARIMISLSVYPSRCKMGQESCCCFCFCFCFCSLPHTSCCSPSWFCLGLATNPIG